MSQKHSKNEDASQPGLSKRLRALGRHAPKHASSSPEDVKQYYDVDRYSKANKRRSRKFWIKTVAVAVVAVIMAVGVAAALYVSDIDHRLTNDVSDQLLDTLEHSEPGDPFYLLLLGIDKDQGRVADTENYGADEHSYRSDSIMLCRIDPKNVKVTMISIHRDTLVEIPGYGQQKINAAYAIGGAPKAIEVVSELAEVPISHYAEVDLDRFISIVDVVGGVTVTLPVPVYDPDYTGLNLPAGEQTLNGTEAALLCRCRHGYDQYGDGDVFRAANQRMVFSEVIKKVMSSNPATIVSTITTMADSVTTDMNLSFILDLAGQMQTINVDKDIMTGMEPTEGVYIGDGWYEQVIEDEWRTMMTRVDQGLPPYDENSENAAAGIAGSAGISTGKSTDLAQSTTPTSATEPAHTEPEPEPKPEPEPEPIHEEPVYEEETYAEPVYVEESYEEPIY